MAGVSKTMGPAVGTSQVVVDGTNAIVRSNHEALEQMCAWSAGHVRSKECVGGTVYGLVR